MLDFSTVKSMAIPEGEVTKIACGGLVLWEKETEVQPLYPFVNGKWEFSDGSWIEISNGNHVHYYARSTKGFFNLSNINQNTSKCTEANNVNNKPIWFTIPSGAECIIAVSNISGYLNDSNFRLANASKSSTFFVGGSTVITNVAVTTTEEIDIGCFFTYINKASETEFDITFTVNGERWI